MQAYTAYYRRFKKSYHVQLQLESIVLRDKSIPRVAALVESMFMAELKNGLLTAGHDLERVRAPVRVDVAGESEQYTRLNGQDQTLKAGDMMIADAESILSSIIYGPDRRTRINPQTRDVLFTVYAPPGIEQEAVTRHLGDIRDYVLIFAPQAEVVLLQVYGSEGTA
jgi:DNA/RNA-binding domain of Phe-tRNA-synthetase-like protein